MIGERCDEGIKISIHTDKHGKYITEHERFSDSEDEDEDEEKYIDDPERLEVF